MRRTILSTWIDTRWAMQLSEADLARRRRRLWDTLTPTLAASPLLAPFAGRPLEDYPIVEPSFLRQNFTLWNTLGLTHGEALRAAEVAEKGGSGAIRLGVVAGFSTGTTGRRGLFIATARERGLYLGQTLAKLMPVRALASGCRIALFLRANSELYSSVSATGRVRFAYFPLTLTVREKSEALHAFAPDTLIAPAHVLAETVRHNQADERPFPTLRRIFEGAEPMGDGERDWIHGALGVRPRSVYQATEGFLAATCRHGSLHLNDDSLIIELEPISGTAAFRPIVTDLKRWSQPMVRVRLDDIIEPLKGRCECGFGGRMIRPLAGRISDIWQYGAVRILPRDVTSALEQALGAGAEWRVEGSATDVVVTVCHESYGDAAITALRALLASYSLTLPISVRVVERVIDGPKRHRVRWMADHG